MDSAEASVIVGADGTVRIPSTVLEAADVHEGDVLNLAARGKGVLTLAAEGRDPDQLWFWTDDWQLREMAADKEEALGAVSAALSGDEFIAALEAVHRTES